MSHTYHLTSAIGKITMIGNSDWSGDITVVLPDGRRYAIDGDGLRGRTFLKKNQILATTTDGVGLAKNVSIEPEVLIAVARYIGRSEMHARFQRLAEDIEYDGYP